ncbi:hypothetical protein [Arthrobacter cryoconiti]|uniref:DUF3558 domain-containing protein n=1 Tax=Arthrobacter cryoconiti TaxID=748907 RepID=A0ABV8QXR5_9MICC|nr:hypothetical protein [Arthrobacter cryoconiti]MCC9068711.1 hypothetical protein [Arthrobacter cryoconiti]
MNTRYPRWAAVAATALLLSGCAGGTPNSDSAALPAPASQGAGVNTSAGSSTSTAEVPPAAAMICSDEVKDNVQKILGLGSKPATTQSWDGSVFSCNYTLPEGNLQLSVQVFEGLKKAQAGAKDLASKVSANPIVGLANLGLPGYQSPIGQVVFAKDSMSLHVDATKMKEVVGPDAIPRTDFAYQIATTILGCWTHG